MGNHLASARSVGGKAYQTDDRVDMPLFPVTRPGVIRDRTDLPCYACFVQMGSAGAENAQGRCKRRWQNSTQPMRQGELPEEESNSVPKVVARELAAYDGQAIPLLEGQQAAPITPKIHVTAQQKQTEHTVNRSAPL